jgi:hypothetical protein
VSNQDGIHLNLSLSEPIPYLLDRMGAFTATPASEDDDHSPTTYRTGFKICCCGEERRFVHTSVRFVPRRLFN